MGCIDHPVVACLILNSALKVGWVERRETQQNPENVGFRLRLNPTYA
ncbi:MAG: hypothetical protein KME23_19815 [Goleter apudmare HA4340-LM2]|jgi:hypothetical protein|nr:hypothetical protein [Goleter apudmare HA4340-LM2]